MAQLVARLNGIQKVRGSNPLGSTTKIPYILYGIFCLFPRRLREFRKIRATAMPCEPLRADAPKREQVHFLRYYGSERVASYESPWLHQKNIIQDV